MKTRTQQPPQQEPTAVAMPATTAPAWPGRRGFLRTAGQAGVLAGAASVGAASSELLSPSTPVQPEGDSRGYHETEHIRKYYRSSRIF